jgi:hypothetical protein
VSLYAVPDDAGSVHYHRDESGTVRGYRVRRDFCGTFMIGDVPDGEQFVEIPQYEVEPLSFDELAERHARERSSVGETG